jgi:hypothetical protein
LPWNAFFRLKNAFFSQPNAFFDPTWSILLANECILSAEEWGMLAQRMDTSGGIPRSLSSNGGACEVKHTAVCPQTIQGMGSKKANLDP